MRNTSCSVLPIPENAFFEQAVFDQDLSQGLLELARLSLELLDLVRGRLTRRVAGEPFLARLQELLRPTVVQVLIDPFLTAQLSNAVLATQAFQHDADLLFSGMMPACGSANIPDCLFSALRYALARLSHRCSSAGLPMSQQSSLTQSAHSVRQVLTAYSRSGNDRSHPPMPNGQPVQVCASSAGSELSRQVPVDLKPDADLNEGRGCPGHWSSSLAFQVATS